MKYFLVIIFLTAFISCNTNEIELSECQKGYESINDKCVDVKIALFMDFHEVTANEFEQCVIAGSCRNSNYETTSQKSTCNLNKVGYENHPMNCINWYGADEYCRWREKRLPTEDEWEYAAKGGENYSYSGSNNPDLVAWYSTNSENTTHEFGTKAPNGYGIYDMSGNVWEWVNTPSGVIFGGCFYNDANYIKIHSKGDSQLNAFSESIGFRCIQIY